MLWGSSWWDDGPSARADPQAQAGSTAAPPPSLKTYSSVFAKQPFRPPGEQWFPTPSCASHLGGGDLTQAALRSGSRSCVSTGPGAGLLPAGPALKCPEGTPHPLYSLLLPSYTCVPN